MVTVTSKRRVLLLLVIQKSADALKELHPRDATNTKFETERVDRIDNNSHQDFPMEFRCSKSKLTQNLDVACDAVGIRQVPLRQSIARSFLELLLLDLVIESRRRS